MASKAELHERADSAALTEQDSTVFFDRLDTFYDTLAQREKVMLAAMVVEALGADDEDSGAGPATMEPPSDDEFKAFAEKLDRFHDELPGEQHLFVDAILGKTWFKKEAEVEGYHWRLLDQRQVPNNQMARYRRACAAAGGDRVYFVRGRPGASRPETGYATLACWDWTHNN